MINKNNIPKHWQIKKLGEVCKLKNGYAFKSGNYESNGVPVIRISDINGGFVSSKNAVRVIPKEDYEDYQVEENDILVAMSGATTGKFGIYKSSEKAYQNQRVGKFKILDERILNNNFLFYQINSLKRQIEKDAYGGAQPNISSSKIEQMQIVVPPLPEQQAIVAKIEELFSELENGKQQLLTAQQQLKVYRQSLLKWAFEGKLTNKNVKEGELPKGWKIVELKDVAKLVSGFAFKSSDYISNGIPLVKISNIGYSQFVWKDQQFLAEQFYKTNSEYIIKSGDLLIALTRPITNNITKVCLYPTNTQDGLLNQRVACIKTLNVVKEYLFLFFQTNKFKQYIRSKFSETLQPNLSPKDLALTKIPLPSLEQQKFIVSELESKLTVCDKIQETISESLQQTETLKQSILKKAFEGRLV